MTLMTAFPVGIRPRRPLTPSVKLLEALRKSAEFLERKGIESPRLNAELLLAHVLSVPRLKLYLNFENELKPELAERYRELIQRRGQGEPLQRLTGSVSFCGYEIATPPGALIPRPETERLAELSWTWLRQRQASQGSARFLDFGTGTGCVAIAIAREVAGAEGMAIDISPEALLVAKENIKRLAPSLEIFQGDGFGALPGRRQFDLIVSNPPYIPTSEIPTLSREVRDHDPGLALDGGADGLDFYRRLAAEAPAWLKRDGRLFAEFGDGQEEALEAIFSASDWIVECIHRDYTARPRILEARLR